jgi:hypothetical protein
MNTKLVATVLLVSLFFISCVFTQLPLSMEATPSMPTLTPIQITPTICFFTRNPGPPPPEVKQRAQEAFIEMGASGIRGTLKVEADGEYSCDRFAVEFVNFEYTLVVPDLQDQAIISEYSAIVKTSAKDSLQGQWNIGTVRIRFIQGNECWWDDNQNACTQIQPLTNY